MIKKVIWLAVKMLLVRDAPTCKGRLGKLMEVTLMARLSRLTARGMTTEEKILNSF